MKAEELGGRVLAAVSRSFYLSIRLLPAPLREPIAVAYLLARASDTIADSAANAPEVRLRHLAAFAEMVRTLSPVGLAELQAEIQPPEASEKELIQQLGPVLDWLAALAPAMRAEVQRVLATIIRGQTLDLERFGKGLAALQTDAELEEYTYLVAGCVGEFWTRVCFLQLGTKYSARDPAQLEEVGRNFGKGLQLVNILRDLPADRTGGRQYLPDESRYLEWVQRAEELVAAGRDYIEAVHPWRVRAACFLPWTIARATLRLLREDAARPSGRRLKVPRRFVYRALLRAVAVGWTNRALPRV